MPPGKQLRGSNTKVDLVADDGNDLQKSSAISIKTFNGIINDVTSTSPVLIEVEEDEEVLVSSIVCTTALSLILQASALTCYYYFATFLLCYILGRTGNNFTKGSHYKLHPRPAIGYGESLLCICFLQ